MFLGIITLRKKRKLDGEMEIEKRKLTKCNGFSRSFWILQCCIFRRKIHLSWWSYSRWPLMSDPRNVGCLQARKSLVKLSKARFPNRGRRQRMESHYLTKETKQQTQNWDNNSKIICHALLRLSLRHPQNTTFCGSKMTICATAAAQTDTQKTFFCWILFYLVFYLPLCNKVIWKHTCIRKYK